MKDGAHARAPRAILFLHQSAEQVDLIRDGLQGGAPEVLLEKLSAKAVLVSAPSGPVLSQRLVQILTIAIVLLIVAIFLWWHLAGRNRRYGSSRRRYRNRTYRGRGRRR